MLCWKNLEGKKSLAPPLIFCKKLRLLIMICWIVHLNISHFIGRHWKSRKSACFAGKSHRYSGAELEFESRSPYSWWNILYSNSHLPSPKSQITTSSSNTYVTFTYIYYLISQQFPEMGKLEISFVSFIDMKK